MKVNFAPSTSFGNIKMYESDLFNLSRDFSCRAKDKDRTFYNVSVEKSEYSDGYIIKFNNDECIDPLAEEDMRIYPEFNYLVVDNMETETEARGNGLGTCMHLTNIIHLMENNVSRIELLAAPSAIPFHIKCGFKPQITLDNEYSLKNIRTIANDTTPELAEYAQDAKELLKTRLSPALKNKLANKILLGYTKKAIKIMDTEDQKALFPHSIDMYLTKKDVIRNKNFYNKLFNKYNVDYQI